MKWGTTPNEIRAPHVPYRTTRDIDVLIEPTIENAEKVRRAGNAEKDLPDVRRLEELRDKKSL